MFLLSPTIFPWDLVILLILTGSVAIFVVCSLQMRQWRRGCRMRGIQLVQIFAAIVFLVIAYGSFVEPELITVTERTVAFPLRHPLRIVVLSDFHLGPYKSVGYVRRVTSRVNALVPDIVILAGDYILDDESGRPIDVSALEPLKDLRPAFGSFAILGNHDHGVHRSLTGISHSPDSGDLLTATLTSLGIRVLVNAHATIQFGNELVAIAGAQDPWTPNGGPNLDQTLRGIDAATPIILAAHNPDIILDTLSYRAQLIVAGHTHGGQIRLPLLGSLAILPTRLGRKFDQGLFTLDDDTTLAITRGVGESGPRARLFAPPEILLLRTENN